MLVKKIFYEKNFIDVISREQKSGSNQGNFFASQLDYIVVVAKNIEKLDNFELDKKLIKTESVKSLYQSSLDPLRGCTNQRYWIKCPDGNFVIPPGSVFPNLKDGEKIKPITREDKVWRWSQIKYLSEKENLIFKKSKRSPLIDQDKKPSKWNVYTLKKNTNSMKPRDYIFGYTNSMGTKELEQLGLKGKFENPKPTELIKYLLSLIKNRKKMIILDFFAGSGTTGHAIIDYNFEFNCSHQFILITNNENQIMREVCYPRIKRVINNYKNSFDDSPSLNFYKTLSIDKNDILDVNFADKIKIT